MTDDLPEGVTDEQRASIAEAHEARQRAETELRQLRTTRRRELVPLWRRIDMGPREDSWGLEIEAALIPRGAAR